MPELPEVETVRRGLEILIGKKVHKSFRSEKKLRISSSLDLKLLNSLVIKTISRRARYLIITLDQKADSLQKDEKSLIIHLGMSGKITISKNFQNLKHDHFAISFEDGLWLIFNDPRRFGFVDLLETKNLLQHKMLKNLGVEPLSQTFNSAYFWEKISGKVTNIKTAIMDNKIVVGVGNIYANESLFAAKISPFRRSFSLSEQEINKLVSSIKKILQNSINLGGSSINDYADTDGNLGNFQKVFTVYGRAGEKCLLCQSVIQRSVQAGRSSFFCPSCQK